MKTTRIIAAAVLFVGGGLTLQLAQAQQPGLQTVRPSGIGRTEVIRHDLGQPGREVIQVRVDIAPGAAFGMHTHPGEEVAYVLEGALEYQFEDKPPITLKAGDSLFIPAGTPHAARNVGSSHAAELATYLVEKEKPLVVVK
ncbi:cupin domain-containing protein [Microvirga sp. VF16]|uniref:cupin domain-containing protein n=1 Tax=Microvirga sp. VF16 TaxID=2807101 RepID=UPI00193E7F6D|nr:cupin domain-containing protein [Microvirga sp. VF16]QRM27599.1 cupin domain-containing protein [Microvirga sp. VF16]